MKYTKSIDRCYIFAESLKFPILGIFAKIFYTNGMYEGKTVIFGIFIYLITAYTFVFCIKQIVNDVFSIKAEKNEFYSNNPENWKDSKLIENKKTKNCDIKQELYTPAYWWEKDKENIRSKNITFLVITYIISITASILLFVYVTIWKKRLWLIIIVFFYINTFSNTNLKQLLLKFVSH